MRRTLIVTKLDADTFNVTDLQGPPAAILGSWVRATCTNGEITLEREYKTGDCPHIGDTVEIELHQ